MAVATTENIPATPAEVKAKCEQFRANFIRLREEVGKIVVGHQEVVDGVLIALFAGGNVLLEGVPGLGKTLLVKTLAQSLTLPFNRIQFTPDLMPADVVGTNIVTEDPATGRRQFEFQKGPIFAQIVLADEINRATPKTQSALLEAMQERQRHRRRHDVQTSGAVPGSRNAEPHRAGRHLPTSRSPARPLPSEAHRRLLAA
ncbi:MAG: AAA family ATPase [Phycisphaerales bacterium]